ncbi:MFS transporter [Companilactobacillus suantsaicola]|uniref:MFS transporter n=1 Tax=Companilactobacillus suantsaicola TaxID=2487723 RepID=A0A4Z0JNE2_9LACO|nr:MFS transporter [Companilactobacillus suantsaicola]TGD23668.1 MFS transporter [Companilactobacillus suantsaicola]
MKKRLFTTNVTLVLIASFFYMMSSMLITPIIAEFTQSIGATSAIAGLIAGIMNITSLLLRPIAGNLTDRISKYQLTMIGASFLLIANLGYGLTTNLAIITGLRIINGIGYTMCSVCMSTWIADLLPPTRVGAGMGIYGLANALGMACGPAISIFLYKHVGHQASFWVAAASSFLLIIIIQFVTNRGLPTILKTTKKRRLRIVHPKVVPIAIILLLFSLPYFATQTYLVSYITRLHLNVSAGIFFPIYAVILLVLRILMRDLFDRIPFKKFLWLSLVGNLIGLIGLTHLTNLFYLLISTTGLAVGYGLMFSICQAKALMVVNQDEHGIANSTFFVGVDLGMSLGPIIGGLISNFLPMTWFYPIMMLTLPLIVLIYWFNRKLLG